MRNLNLVLAGCTFAGGLFWVYRQALADPVPSNLDPFLARVNSEIAKSLAEGRGPRETFLTLVIGDSRAPQNPLLLAKRAPGLWGRILGKKNDGDFVVRLAKAGYPLGWNPTVPLDPNNKALLEPFARMLVTAREADIPVRILAQGQAAAFVLHAAEAAGAPVVERIVGAGVRLSDITPRVPRGKEQKEDLVLVWIDPDAVPRSLHVEGTSRSFERDPGYDEWETILVRALKGGALSLRPREAPQRTAAIKRKTPSGPGPGGLRRRSGLNMLKKEVEMAALPDDPGRPATATTVGGLHRIGYSGWTIPKGFKDSTYMEPRGGGGALFGRSPHMVTLLTTANDGSVGKSQNARDYCDRMGLTVNKIEFKGFPAEACTRFAMPEDSRPKAEHDVITIFDGATEITVKYTYNHPGDRDGGLQLFHNILGSLEKE